MRHCCPQHTTNDILPSAHHSLEGLSRTNMVDHRGPQYQFPHRKPVPFHVSEKARLHPLTQIVPEPQPQGRSSPPPPPPYTETTSSAIHSRTRTVSSSVFPNTTTAPKIQSNPPPPPKQQPLHSTASFQVTMNHYRQPARRTLSNATASTSTTGGGGGGGGLLPVRTSSTSDSIGRSGSSRSAASPTSYVALMRKQKATVWCDRSQYEDPRAVAIQKAARIRAEREIVGSAGRTFTAGSGSFTGAARAKIRHHAKGQAAAVGYGPVELVGGVGAVPMRLSASEVGEGNSDDDGDDSLRHASTASKTSRSSVGSSRASRISDMRAPPPANPYAAARRFSGEMAPSNGGGAGRPMGAHDPDPTPMPHHYHAHHPQQQQQQQRSTSALPARDAPPEDYFTCWGGTGDSGHSGDSHTTMTSSSSGTVERERGFGGLGQMSERGADSPSTMRDHPPHRPRESVDELRRRGSVDDRSMTMTGRLFVANPDPD